MNGNTALLRQLDAIARCPVSMHPAVQITLAKVGDPVPLHLRLGQACAVAAGGLTARQVMQVHQAVQEASQ